MGAFTFGSRSRKSLSGLYSIRQQIQQARIVWAPRVVHRGLMAHLRPIYHLILTQVLVSDFADLYCQTHVDSERSQGLLLCN